MRKPQSFGVKALRRLTNILIALVILSAVGGGLVYVLFLRPPLKLLNLPGNTDINIPFSTKVDTGSTDRFGPYAVVDVVDGDTIDIEIGSEEVTVRLVGVDAPESVHPDSSKNTPEGKKASEWLCEYLEGKSVYLEYDIEREDIYGRTLAYVYDEDGNMLQEEILSAGYANLLTIQPNSRYADRFATLYEEAQVQEKGLWNTTD